MDSRTRLNFGNFVTYFSEVLELCECSKLSGPFPREEKNQMVQKYKKLMMLYIYIYISKDLKDFNRMNWFIKTKLSNYYAQIVFKVITQEALIYL